MQRHKIADFRLFHCSAPKYNDSAKLKYRQQETKPVQTRFAVCAICLPSTSGRTPQAPRTESTEIVFAQRYIQRYEDATAHRKSLRLLIHTALNDSRATSFLESYIHWPATYPLRKNGVLDVRSQLPIGCKSRCCLSLDNLNKRLSSTCLIHERPKYHGFSRVGIRFKERSLDR